MKNRSELKFGGGGRLGGEGDGGGMKFLSIENSINSSMEEMEVVGMWCTIVVK